jgi:hypothetical protein
MSLSTSLTAIENLSNDVITQAILLGRECQKGSGTPDERREVSHLLASAVYALAEGADSDELEPVRRRASDLLHSARQAMNDFTRFDGAAGGGHTMVTNPQIGKLYRITCIPSSSPDTPTFEVGSIVRILGRDDSTPVWYVELLFGSVSDAGCLYIEDRKGPFEGAYYINDEELEELPPCDQ